MIPNEAAELSSLDEAFTRIGYTKLLKTLKKAGFRSLASLMVLPREALLEIPHIGSAAISCISEVLQWKNLPQRDFNQDLFSFIDRTFGDIEEAPIGVLQVAIVRNGVVNWPIFAPLELVTALEERKDYLTINHLLQSDAHTLRFLLESMAPIEAHVHDLHEDIHHLQLRLKYLGFDFGARQQMKMYVVK